MGGELPRLETAPGSRTGLHAGSTITNCVPWASCFIFCASVSSSVQWDEGTYLLGLL